MRVVAHFRGLVLFVGGGLGAVHFGIGCDSDSRTRSCAPLPCPAPGWDPAACACRAPASFDGAVTDAAVDAQPSPGDAARPPHDGQLRDAPETDVVHDGASLCRPAL